MSAPGLAATAAAAVAAIPLSALLTEVCRRAAVRTGLVDRPGGHRLHTRPTPYLGGLAVAAATLAPALVLAMGRPSPGGVVLLAVLITLAAASVAVVGLLDDIAPLGIASRLAAETAAGVLVVLAGPALRVTGLAWLDAGLTVAWIVLLTNSFNLLDNMDAAAAAIAGVSAVVLGVATAGGGSPLWWCLAGACAGFLFHNRPPARIFLGDAGSLFVGFVIAVGTVVAASQQPAVAPALALVALVDTALVVVSRRRAGRSWRTGGSDHIAHRLRALGLSAAQVAAVLAGAAALSGGLALLVRGGQVPAVVGLAVAAGAGVAAVLLLLPVPVYAAPPVPRAHRAVR